MFQFSLRTLIILMTLGGPLGALGYKAWQKSRQVRDLSQLGCFTGGYQGRKEVFVTGHGWIAVDKLVRTRRLGEPATSSANP